jgi:hypothetical protein
MQHLRPPPELKIDEVGPAALTTYAGVLLRDLLDRFNGDVTLAVSAYNAWTGAAEPAIRQRSISGCSARPPSGGAGCCTER